MVSHDLLVRYLFLEAVQSPHLFSLKEQKCKGLQGNLTLSVIFPPVDNVDVSSTANLYKSLAQAAPEIKQCVDACNFIAESTRQQNNIGSVSVNLNV